MLQHVDCTASLHAGFYGPTRRQRDRLAGLRAFLSRAGAPKLTALQLNLMVGWSRFPPARVLAALPPLHRVKDLRLAIQWDMPSDAHPCGVMLRDYPVFWAIMAGCPALQQLRIHALTRLAAEINLTPFFWRQLFHGDGSGGDCLPASSLRYLQLSAAPGFFHICDRFAPCARRFPSLEWLQDLVIKSRTVRVTSYSRMHQQIANPDDTACSCRPCTCC